MTGTVLVDQVTVKVGANSGSATSIYPEVLIIREASETGVSMKPILVVNTVYPIGFRQAHKWVEGELTVKSEAQTAFNGYINASATNITIPFVGIEYKTYTGSTYYFAMAGDSTYFMMPEYSMNKDEEVLATYKFVAQSYSGSYVRFF